MSYANIRTRLAGDVAAPTRWPVLDGVRGAALVAVVTYHLIRFMIDDGGHQLSWPWWAFMGTARFGLDAFFVLSGILVVVSWRAVRRRAAGMGSALALFWKRRLQRILPAYWLSLAVFIPLLASDLFGSLEGLGKLALFVTVQQNLIDTLPDQVNTPYWTLTTEFHFYLLVPLVSWLALRRGWRWLALAATIALSVAWWSGLRGDLAASFIFGRLDQFVVGAIVGDLIVSVADGRRSRLVSLLQRRGAAWILALAALGVGTWHGSRLWQGPASPFEPWMHPVMGILLAGLFVHLLCAEHSRGRALLCRPSLRFLGLISYSVYLWHYPLQRHGLRFLGATPDADAPALTFLMAGILLTGLCLAAGIASYLVAERPFLRRKEPAAADADRPAPIPVSARAGVP